MSTSFIAVVMALMMVLSGMCGTMETLNAAEPVSVDVGFELEGDISALVGSAVSDEESVSMVTDLINALSMKVSMTPSAAQLQIMLSGNPVASAAVQEQDDSWAMVSDLFPATMLTAAKSTAEAMTEDMADSSLSSSGLSSSSLSDLMDKIDPEALAAAFSGPCTEALEAFEARFGEWQDGIEYSPDGEIVFTKSAVCDITMKEAVEVVFTALKKVLADENVAPLVSALGDTGLSAESLDEALASMQEDESSIPELGITKYTNDNGDTGLEIIMAKDEQQIQILSVTSGQVTKVTGAVLDQMNFNLVINDEARTYDLSLQFSAPTMQINLNASVTVGDDSTLFTVEAAVPMGAEPLVVRLSGTVAKDAPVFEAGEDLKVVSLETLMQDEETQNAFSAELMTGMMTVLAKVAQEFPSLMNLMMPATTTTGSPVE